MATGSLRPPKPLVSKELYTTVAAVINENFEEMVDAIGNVAGVCVIVLKGDVYRSAELIRQLLSVGNDGKLAKVEVYPDSVNWMVHIK